MVETPLGILNKVDNILPKDRIGSLGFWLWVWGWVWVFSLGHKLGLFSFKIH